MTLSAKTSQNLKAAVAAALPWGNKFSVIAERTHSGNSHVLRVVTPAWKKLPRMDRILKMQHVIMPLLSKTEQDRVFRISVLTPEEWKEIRSEWSFRPGKIEILVQKRASLKPAKVLSAKKKPRPASARRAC